MDKQRRSEFEGQTESATKGLGRTLSSKKGSYLLVGLLLYLIIGHPFYCDPADMYIAVNHCPHTIYLDGGLTGTVKDGGRAVLPPGGKRGFAAFESGPGYIGLSLSSKGPLKQKVAGTIFKNINAQREIVIGINESCQFDPSIRE